MSSPFYSIYSDREKASVVALSGLAVWPQVGLFDQKTLLPQRIPLFHDPVMFSTEAGLQWPGSPIGSSADQ